ncbi:hypothetical protein [Streptomyces sp. V4I8]|uniref:hypothetical protein n=1 Tax=Streptomyces sp. V4I8 TaxID=3156469 RepID=UPI003512FD47
MRTGSEHAERAVGHAVPLHPHSGVVRTPQGQCGGGEFAGAGRVDGDRGPPAADKAREHEMNDYVRADQKRVFALMTDQGSGHREVAAHEVGVRAQVVDG